MLNWAFGSNNKRGSGPPSPSYEEAKRITEKGSDKEKAILASCGDVPPEFLYYFATEGSADVKSVVARNHATPLQADLVLADDVNEEVRELLADKIGEKAQDIEEADDPKSVDMVHTVLEKLARDQLPQVRCIISDAIRTLDSIPKPIVSLLAQDVDELVASPVLEFSPLLSDFDLAGLVADGLGETAMQSVARRDGLGEDAADALANTGDINAIITMLENEGATIGRATFNTIADLAEHEERLHAPMVDHRDLPAEAARKITNFISDALLAALSERNDLDAQLAAELKAKIEAQLSGLSVASNTIDLGNPQSIADAHSEAKKGRIPTHKIMRRLKQEDYAFVIACMALMSGISQERMAAIVQTGDVNKFIAVAWKCGFDPYMTETLQKKLPSIPEASVLPPGQDGGFPISHDLMASDVLQLQA